MNVRTIIMSMLMVITHMSMAVVVRRTAQQWNSQRYNYPLSVVLYYSKTQGSEHISAMKEILKQVSMLNDFTCAAIRFVSIDVSNSGSEVHEGLTLSRLPAYVLYRNGDPIRNNGLQKPVILYDTMSVSMLRDFINTYFGNDVKKIVAAKRRAFREREESDQSKTTLYYYVDSSCDYGPSYPSYYWHWPQYNWYDCGSCSTSVGFGVSIDL